MATKANKPLKEMNVSLELMRRSCLLDQGYKPVHGPRTQRMLKVQRSLGKKNRHGRIITG